MNHIKDFLEIINSIPKNHSGCKIWTKTKCNLGYGFYSYLSKSYRVHRLIYEINYPGNYKWLVIRHKCDTPSCCNIEHLECGSQNDNIQDMIRRNRNAKGSNMPTSKLSESDVLQIKKLLKTTHTKIIAKQFNVANTTISAIKNGRTWKDVSGGNKNEDFRKFSRMQRDQTGSKNKLAILNEEKVKEIKERLKKGEFAKSIAKDFDVHVNTIFSIKQNRTWINT